ncbi:MAG: hypothetical protein AB1899_14305 [Pseudomonadota bacterium]
MTDLADPAELELESEAQALLNQAMTGYRQDPHRGDFLLEYACTQAADPLPLYRAIIKFYNRQRRFDQAQDFAARSLAEAARQCGLPPDAALWQRNLLPAWNTPQASQALLALKAMAFIALRRNHPVVANQYLAILNALDSEDGSGASVLSALVESLDGDGQPP